MTINEYIEKVKKKYNNFYDYSKTYFRKREDRITIICPKHGEFTLIARNHLEGAICPQCKKEELHNKNIKRLKEKFYKKCDELYNGFYDYSKSIFESREDNIIVICPKHGEFTINVRSHMGGAICPKCRNLIKNKKPKLTTEEFIKKCIKKYSNKFTYENTIFIDYNTPTKVTCKIHGEIEIIPKHFLYDSKFGCKYCSVDSTTLTYEDFIEKAREIHGDKYDYSKVEYNGNKNKVCIICPKHGEFWMTPNAHLSQKQNCPKCNNHISKWELEINDFIKSINVEIDTNNREILDGKEIDILISSFNVGIECDGLIYHSELYNKDKNYHITKTNIAKEKNIQLIHIFEDEWLYKKEIVKSRLNNLFYKNEYKIYARKCQINIVSNKDVKIFLENNHIQGYVPSKINLGLYYNDELVSLMTFGNLRKCLGSDSKEQHYELLRFCNKLNTSVIGGASKLFNYFKKNFNPKEIISYCDLRWSNGNLYEVLGFNLSHISKPNYFYVNNGKRENRFNYRKDKLIEQGFDKNKTEHEIMLDRGYYRIYDCGCKVYKYIVNKC